MTGKELERLERIAVQILGGLNANHELNDQTHQCLVTYTLEQAQELIKQLDALKIPE